MRTYDYDVAISLCQQDIEFAQKLIHQINPSLKVFFYGTKQDQIIGQSGPEVFARTFKEKSRIVVVLSRDEWSESFYTDIERNAIIDRTSVKNEGYDFLMIIPMVPNQVPTWYPSTRIYIDPRKFKHDEIAKFIEFKVAEKGGTVKPVSLEDRYEQLKSRIEEKRLVVFLQESEIAIDAARREIGCIKSVFNEKIRVLERAEVGAVEHFLFSSHVGRSYIGIGDFLLECLIESSEDFGARIVTTQDFILTFTLAQGSNGNAKARVFEETRFQFYFTPTISGWAVPSFHDYPTGTREAELLFRNRTNQQRYELTKPQQSALLVDSYFQKLLSLASKSIRQFL